MVPLSLVVCSLIAMAIATDVQQCPGQSFENLKDHVILTPCKRLPCRLKKGTDMHITMKFIADGDYDDVFNHVNADVFGVALPFPGVDGNSICDFLETEAGEKTSCPLKKGETYVYKNSFPVLSFYPLIDVKVHWSLRAKKDLICFEVPAKIVK